MIFMILQPSTELLIQKKHKNHIEREFRDILDSKRNPRIQPSYAFWGCEAKKRK